MNSTVRFVMVAIFTTLPLIIHAAPSVRTLEFRVAVDGKQDWRNEHRWGKATTKHRHMISTQLRSDGRLYLDNLLDPDPQRRMAIKSDWYLFQGLLQLKAENGGALPRSAGRQEITAESLMESRDGLLLVTADMSPQRIAALQALEDRSPEELERFMEGYEQPGGRWMYFEGFAGCVNQLELKLTSRFEGDIALKQGQKAPYEMKWDADNEGTPEQKQSLCRRYVVTYAPESDTLVVENAYLPSPLGTSVRREFGRTIEEKRELPLPGPVMDWVAERLRNAPGEGKQKTTLPLPTALDGNDTVLGQFTGEADVALEWSFR